MDKLVEAIGHVRAHRDVLQKGPLLGDIDRVLKAAEAWSDHVAASDAEDDGKDDEPEDA